jgi:SWIM/SEC-C metal-binding protein
MLLHFTPNSTLSITIYGYNRPHYHLIPIVSEFYMSKLFFKGRIDARQNHVVAGYNVNRDVKAGSKEAPIAIVVNTDIRKAEIETVLAQHTIIATITVDAAQDENTLELDTLLNKPQPTTFEKMPNRNDPCRCGSGKKFKKCCA